MIRPLISVFGNQCAAAVHLITPAAQYLDKGKSTLAVTR